MKVIPGIQRLKIPIPESTLRYVNVYLVEGSDGYLLVDTGWDNSTAFDSLKSQLTQIGATLEDITRILVTHVHGDHYGLVHTIKQHSQAEVIIHELEKVTLLNNYRNVDDALGRIEELFRSNGAPDDEIPIPGLPQRDRHRLATPVIPDTTLRGGETITSGEFTLRVIWTPGHSPGHVCLYEPSKKILFAGDHVLPVITPNISLQPHTGENPLGDFINSLKELSELDVELVLPAHEYTYTDLQARIGEILHHHRQRNLEILETLKDEPKTAYQISSAITWVPESGGIKYKNLAPMDKRMAVLETLAHLKAMTIEGEVEYRAYNGTIYYKQT